MSTCPICLEQILPQDEYVAPCSDKHRFHKNCIVAYAQTLITKAVRVNGKHVSVTVGALPKCPMCRSALTWAHRTPQETSFYVISKNQCMLMLGSVDEGGAAPRLRLKRAKRS